MPGSVPFECLNLIGKDPLPPIPEAFFAAASAAALMHGHGQELVADATLDGAVFPPGGTRPLSVGGQRRFEDAFAVIGLDGEGLRLPRLREAERELASGEAQREASLLHWKGRRAA
jgi:hypothetical protein